MLLIDGARYELWTPPNEVEFENVFGEHASDIFGSDSKYFDLKHKLASKAGTGSIPDGYVITFGEQPQVHIIELELESHSLQHIVTQIINISTGISNPSTQQKICNRIEDEISQDDILRVRIEKAIKPKSIHRFLSDCFSNTLPMINIVIDKNSPQLEEALNRINCPHRIIEFQTFTRLGAESVHAHLFGPLYEVFTKEPVNAENKTVVRTATKLYEHRITINNLLEKGLVSSFQKIFVEYKNNKYEAEIQPNGKLKLLHNGKEYDSPSLAATAITNTSVNGWVFWQVIDKKGSVSVIDDLRKQIR
jgi:hypothetical protein